jgi:hypothetical protein
MKNKINMEKTKVQISNQLKEKIKEQQQNEGQVVIHFTFKNTTYPFCELRIWKTIFLKSKNCNHKSQLHHFEQIKMYPNFTTVLLGKSHHFMLIFSGLPKECAQFDLIEEIHEPGGFKFLNIKRNESDIYEITFS